MNQHADLKSDILISIQPEYAQQIIDGCKTVELRRRFTQGIEHSARLFIYSSGSVGAIVGSVEVKKVSKLRIQQIWRQFKNEACVHKSDFDRYFDGLEFGYALTLGDIVTFVDPLNRTDIFSRWGIRPPQSYMFISPEIAGAIAHNSDEISPRHKHNIRNRRQSAGR